MHRVLVTGGAGFLGQYLIQRLADAGHDIRVIDLKPSASELVPIGPLCSRITFGVDITRPEALRGHCEGIDSVIHLAGLVSFWRGHTELLRKVNAEGTANVCREARAAGVRRFVHVSSVAAIGYNERGDEPIDETYCFDWSKVPHKGYMLSKHLAEEEVLRACDEGLDAVIVNPGLMWGPGDLLNSSKLILGIHRGKLPLCPYGGTNIVDVRDIARFLPAMLSAGRTKERYILGGFNLSFREVCQTVAAELGVRPPRWTLPRFLRPILYGAAWLNESLRRTPPAVTADNIDSSYRFRYFLSTKAHTELGWSPEIPFEKLIRDSIAWLKRAGKLT